jgi:hypothetical protein
MAAADFPAFFTRGLKYRVYGIIPQSHQAHSASTGFTNQITCRKYGEDGHSFLSSEDWFGNYFPFL